ncbi:MAG: cell division protein FtsZ [Rikenellaceae bacterium]|jgi:cell division protein FtsZ|nr:cell division protein FtsZ [Rikenellaceae bacterium]
MPEASPSIIMVVGVGGGGSNAVNHMYRLGISDVGFMVCNTDVQALSRSRIPIKVVLGQSLTQGLGAGNKPEIGRAAAEESEQEIIDLFKRYATRMVFVTAGMGGGTGTGAAPVIAKAARQLDILTIAIVTIPFKTEGPKRFSQAIEGIEEMRKYVDSLLVINNENILELHGELGLSEAFGMADDILASAAKGIAEIITGNNYINVDFRDIQTVMSNSGVALMGSALANGEDRADKAVRAALTSPLLNHRDISGAKNIMLNITSGTQEATLKETYYITDFVQRQTGNMAELIWGAGSDESLGDEIKVTIIATGFEAATIDNIFSGTPMVDSKSDPDPLPEEGEGAPEEEREAGADGETGGKPVGPFRIRRDEGGKSVIVASSDADGFRITEADKAPEPDPVPPVNYDELERSPAWLRRKTSFSDTPAEDKSSRVTLKDDAQTARKGDDPKSNALF